MSIAAALNNALSGLNAAARGAELISSNVANATTPGYGRRELELSSRRLGTSGAGVEVTNVRRVVDQALVNDRRVADAGAGSAGVTADFLSRLQGTIGTPDQAGSLGARIQAFGGALIQAASLPESDARLASVLDSAKSLTRQINTISDTIQQTRQTADQAIATQVGQVNDALSQVADMNVKIRSEIAAGRDASTLMDQRQQLVDRISSVIPLREVPRDHGQIALVTTGGAMMLDGRPATLGFTPTPTITADMTVASGGLSGLMLNGKPIETGGDGALIAGGAMAAQFALRDTAAPAAQAQIDGLARDLVARFADPAVDPTLAAGDAGLFTDTGAAFDPANEVGLAGRLSLNDAVDPGQGGALWRLRDGINATAPGPAGDASLLGALSDALSAPRIAVSGGLPSGAHSLSGLAGDILSGIGSAQQTAEAEASYATAKADALHQMELESGVDTDQEMQKLLLVQQSYSANAKVIAAIDGLMQRLLEI